MFYSTEETHKHLKLIEEVNNFIEKGSERFIILGHSFGGIISYSLRKELYNKIDKIITVASPHRANIKWLKELLRKIDYNKEINISNNRSFGFFFDKTVPFFFTKYSRSSCHKNLFGTHNSILHSKAIIKEIIESL
jgi:hypothetical protein